MAKSAASGRKVLFGSIAGGLILIGGTGVVRFIGNTNIGGDNNIQGSTVNSNNTTSVTANNTANYTNNTTILISADSFAERNPAAINLSSPDVQISPAGTVVSKKALPDTEQEKLGRKHMRTTSSGETFLNGYLGIALLKTSSTPEGIDYATVTVQGLKPESFNLKAGWSQDFLTPYGRFRLVVDKIAASAGWISASVYDLG